jgi:phosphatidylserine decarboxylase
MSIAASIRSQLVPVHQEGYPFIAIFALVTLILFWLWPPFGWMGVALTIWCTLFFRDPVRVTPVGDGLLVSPADGRISMVTQAAPPPELGMGEAPLPRISIFMSVFDCHINRSPIAGRIERVVYKAGVFLNADLDKASEDNERNSFLIAGPDARIAVVQIAGLVARRIVSWVSEGGSVAAGQRLGMIRFGSRVDVYLPAGGTFLVAQGQRSVAGETVIADLRAPHDGRNFRAD